MCLNAGCNEVTCCTVHLSNWQVHRVYLICREGRARRIIFDWFPLRRGRAHARPRTHAPRLTIVLIPHNPAPFPRSCNHPRCSSRSRIDVFQLPVVLPSPVFKLRDQMVRAETHTHTRDITDEYFTGGRVGNGPFYQLIKFVIFAENRPILSAIQCADIGGK